MRIFKGFTKDPNPTTGYVTVAHKPTRAGEALRVVLRVDDEDSTTWAMYLDGTDLATLLKGASRAGWHVGANGQVYHDDMRAAGRIVNDPVNMGREDLETGNEPNTHLTTSGFRWPNTTPPDDVAAPDPEPEKAYFHAHVEGKHIVIVGEVVPDPPVKKTRLEELDDLREQTMQDASRRLAEIRREREQIVATEYPDWQEDQQ